MSKLSGLAALALVAFAPAAWPASADRVWMTEAAMRAAFIGRTLDGNYTSGLEWTETYDPVGRLDYRDSARSGGGHWFFRGSVFCTFYDPGHGLSGGCFTAFKAGANCYEFYLAGLSDPGPGMEGEPGLAGPWVARAWRRGEPSTCVERPTV